MKADEKDPELVTSELAERWGMNPGTLMVWRSMGKGPRYNKRGGKVTYSLSDIMAYEKQCKIDPNTP